MPIKSTTLRRALCLLQNDAPFVCASCRHRRALSAFNGAVNNQLHRFSRQRPPYARRASTIPSVTAVNAQRDIPPEQQALHKSLSALEHEAAVYVNLSQLKLALRGLESENAVTRVAVLGLDGQAGPRRLVRALLADPLASELVWEKQLADVEDRDARALLLRYGEQLNYDQRHPLVRTLSVPSPALLSHNLEIIIQSLTPNDNADGRTMDEYLVPLLEMPNSASGRVATVTYPVHKALLYGEGFRGLSVYVPIARKRKLREEVPMVFGVINGQWTTASQNSDSEKTINPVNVHLGETAIQLFRQSLENSIKFEHRWFESGLSAISAWLLEGTSADSATIKPSVRRLTATILSNAEQAILREDQEKKRRLLSASVAISTRQTLDLAIQSWAESAHSELRDQLGIAFHSKSWRKTAWWKLFWRVDDVGMIATDVLQRHWLVEAEKELLWLTGRIEQAGLSDTPSKPEPKSTKSDPAESYRIGAFPPSPRAIVTPPSPSQLLGDETLIPIPTQTPTPYPQTLSLARHRLSLTTPPLTAHAQRLLLTALSTTALTSSLSALLYISLLETSVYEAGGIAALGFVWAMRTLQRKWEGKREEWVEEVREEGRVMLRGLEAEMGGAVEEGGLADRDGEEEGGEERERARRGVEGARKALEGMR